MKRGEDIHAAATIVRHVGIVGVLGDVLGREAIAGSAAILVPAVAAALGPASTGVVGLPGVACGDGQSA